MEPGEKELRKAFEDVTTKNVKTTVDYSTETRKMVRDLEEKVGKLEGMLQSQTSIIEAMRAQLACVQTRVFSGGT